MTRRKYEVIFYRCKDCPLVDYCSAYNEYGRYAIDDDDLCKCKKVDDDL